MSTVVVAGATGFVGRALIRRLIAGGDTVIALARRPPNPPLPDGVRFEQTDVGDLTSLSDALVGTGADHAYYLVHSMAAGGDFAARDRALATTFGAAAATAGLERIVYLGGLGDDPSSTHLASRQEVGRLLGAAGVDVVELRAAVVLGAGSISFEMLRYLTERLPLMVCPRWVHTRIQPIALGDLLDHLVAAPRVAPGIYEIGGADVTTYREMIAAYARVRDLPRRLVLDVPFLTPHLSSYWVDAVTPVDRRVSHALIESLATEVVVQDGATTRAAFALEPMGLDDALRRALDAQADDVTQDLFALPDGPCDGVYAMHVRMPLALDQHERAVSGLADVGGDLAWYGVPWLWRIRLGLGRLWGERLLLGRPPELTAGAAVDWWTAVSVDDRRLVLRADWRVGDAWLGYRIDDDVLHEAGALRPRGVLGFLYWKLLEPVHRRVFDLMARRRLAPPGPRDRTSLLR